MTYDIVYHNAGLKYTVLMYTGVTNPAEKSFPPQDPCNRQGLGKSHKLFDIF